VEITDLLSVSMNMLVVDTAAGLRREGVSWERWRRRSELAREGTLLLCPSIVYYQVNAPTLSRAIIEALHPPKLV
jgi:hypothetical protein